MRNTTTQENSTAKAVILAELKKILTTKEANKEEVKELQKNMKQFADSLVKADKNK